LRILTNFKKIKILTPIIPLKHPLFEQKNVNVYAKLDYLNHPVIQGNKLYKLKGQLPSVKKHQKQGILTFGGAYSNHIAATAEFCQLHHLDCIGLIRGNELKNNPSNWSPTLKKAYEAGMKLRFLSRKAYRLCRNNHYLIHLQSFYPDHLMIPEGGTNRAAMIGLKECALEIQKQMKHWDYLICPVGTGGTLSGLLNHYPIDAPKKPNQKIIGICAVADIKNQSKTIQTFASNASINWTLMEEYVGSGYGKNSPELVRFKEFFEQHFQIPLDPIYNNKTTFALFDLIQNDYFEAGSHILWLHTGGLQGNSHKLNCEFVPQPIHSKL
jgi:1-aminocyclopropane-1-carboxylate deaminase